MEDVEMKLSIIVPIYNVAPYLHKCVDSLLAQDITDYEIILVDDGSTDGSSEIADSICDKAKGLKISESDILASTPYTLHPTPEIKIIHQENAGLSAARNAGIAKAQGEYIWFVDSDDYVEPNVLGKLMEQIERDNLDVLRFRYQNVKESGEAFVPHDGMKVDYNDYSNVPIDGLTFLNERMWIQCYAWQFVVKKNIVEKELFTNGIYFEDTDWTPRMLLKAKRVASTNRITYNYFWRDGSITLTSNKEKLRKHLHDKIIIMERLNDWGKLVTNHHWFDTMISSLMTGIINSIASNFYKERKNYIKQVKNMGILPLTTFHIPEKAIKKVNLINFSIHFSLFITVIKQKMKNIIK